MLYLIRLLIAFLSAYFWGRIIFLCFSNPKEKNNIISKFHSFFLGLGVTSISFWFYTIATNGYNSYYHIVETFFVAVTYIYLGLNKYKKTTSSQTINISENTTTYKKKRLLINYLTAILFSMIAVLCLVRNWKYPDGTCDALFMWNFRAKFLACGNEAWNRMYFDTFDYSHRDYPLFLPCTLARCFNYAGIIDSNIPLFFSWLFTFVPFILVYLYLKKLKNKYYSVLAISILAHSPTFFFYGCVQYSDMPLAVFFLISLYEFIIWNMRNKNLPWIGMFFACFCIWIKNEGIPLYLSYSLIIIYCLYKKEKNLILSAKCFFKIIAASLPIFISVLFVRYFAHSENDLIFGLSDRLKQIIELERYKIIMPNIWLFIKQHFWIMFIPIFLFTGFIDKKYYKFKYLFLIIILMNLLFILAYLITPHDLVWHVENSYPRIANVYLPSLMFLGCLLFEYKRE